MHLKLVRKELLESPELLTTLMSAGNVELLLSLLESTEIISPEKNLTMEHTLIALAER